jgi:hypothetical protein
MKIEKDTNYLKVYTSFSSYSKSIITFRSSEKIRIEKLSEESKDSSGSFGSHKSFDSMHTISSWNKKEPVREDLTTESCSCHIL